MQLLCILSIRFCDKGHFSVPEREKYFGSHAQRIIKI